MSHKQDQTFNMDTGLYTTPGWTLSEKKLSNLVGQKVALTTRSNEKSYLGGTIVGFVPAKQTSNKKRYDVVFKPESKFINNKVIMLGMVINIINKNVITTKLLVK